jgi:hypothetical protein
MQVLNDTADVCRFFNATPHAEFLSGCVKQTIEVDLPRETELLARYAGFRPHRGAVDMPERTFNLLFHCLHQDGGTLSRRARTSSRHSPTARPTPPKRHTGRCFRRPDTSRPQAK